MNFVNKNDNHMVASYLQKEKGTHFVTMKQY